MSDRPYSELNKEKLILRDYLAADRTVLANERTFLAYIRTALTLFAAGVTLIYLFPYALIQVVGWLFMPLGLITFIVGFRRYRRLGSRLRALEATARSTPHTE
jgi:putative membrane protein